MNVIENTIPLSLWEVTRWRGETVVVRVKLEMFCSRFSVLTSVVSMCVLRQSELKMWDWKCQKSPLPYYSAEGEYCPVDSTLKVLLYRQYSTLQNRHYTTIERDRSSESTVRQKWRGFFQNYLGQSLPRNNISLSTKSLEFGDFDLLLMYDILILMYLLSPVFNRRRNKSYTSSSTISIWISPWQYLSFPLF